MTGGKRARSIALVLAIAGASFPLPAVADAISVVGATDPEDVRALSAGAGEAPARVLRLLMATDRYGAASVDLSSGTPFLRVQEAPVIVRIEIQCGSCVPEEIGISVRSLPLRKGQRAFESDLAGLIAFVVDRLNEAGYDDPKVDLVLVPLPGGDKRRVRAELRIDLGAPTTLDRIEVSPETLSGEAPWLAGELGKKRVVPGARIDRGAMRDVAKRWRARAQGQGYLGVRATVSEEASEGKVTVRFELSRGPEVDLFVDGQPLNAKRRASLLTDAPSSVDATATAVCQSLRGDLEASGFFDAVVRAATTGARIDVVTEPGERLHVTAITADLPEPEKDLVLGLRTQKSGYHLQSGYALGRLRRDDLAADRLTLEKRLRYDGFLDAQVKEPVVTRQRKKISVHFPVEAGARTIVSSLDSHGVAPWALLDLPLQLGGPASPQRIFESREAIRERYAERGYLRCRVRASAGDDGQGRRRVVLEVDAGPPCLVSEVVVRGAHSLSPSLLRKLGGVAPGERRGRITEERAGRRLRRVPGIAGTLVTSPGPASNRGPLVMEVRESPRFRFRYALGYNSEEGVRGTLGFSDVSLFSSARSLSLLLRGGRLDHRGELSYRDPFGLGGDRALNFTLFAGRERREGFSFTKKGALLDIDLFFREARHRTTELAVRVLRKEISLLDVAISLAEVPRQERDTSILSGELSFIVDRRDDPINPRNGWRGKASVQAARPGLGADAFFEKAQEDAFFYLPLRPSRPQGAVLAIGERFGVARPGGGQDQVPITERFFLGGYQSMRAFGRDAVGPTDDLSGSPLGGEAFHFATAELRVPIYGKFGAALFYERGNVFGKLADLSASVEQDVGVGVRYMTPAGPLRVEYAAGIGTPSRESRVFLSLGEAF